MTQDDRHSPAPRRPARTGQALVELALCLPVLTMLVFGGILFAHHAYTRQVAVMAAQEGMRVAGAEGRTLDEGASQAAALLAASLGRRAERFTITTACVGGTGGACVGATAVTLCIAGSYPLRVPWAVDAGIPIDVELFMYKEGIRISS